MSGSVSMTFIVGRLGDDPKKSQVGNVHLSVATSERWRDKDTGERRDETEWHRVVIKNEALGKIALQYLRKGALVQIQGKNRTRKWEKDGHTFYTTEVIVAWGGALTMLEGKGNGGDQAAQRPGDYGEDEGGYDDHQPQQQQRRSSLADDYQPGPSARGRQADAFDDEIPF